MTLTKKEIKALNRMFKDVNNDSVIVKMGIQRIHGERLFRMEFTDTENGGFLGSFECPVELEEEEC
jgi:hypothetical protein